MSKAFRRGDKVVHESSEESMVGTIVSNEGDYCVVEFFVPGRRKGGYTVNIDIPNEELTHCTTEHIAEIS